MIEVGEITQKLKEHIALAEDMGFVPGTHVAWPITIYNFSSRRSDTKASALT